MSSLISAELVATCNSLGYYDVQAGKYYADENTVESIKDLIRYLKRDDETHDIRRQLGETKVVQTDLLPLLKNYWEQSDLFDVLLRLLVNLTTPALMLWNEEIPTERTSRNQYLQVEEHLRLYKQAFADDKVWATLSTKISKILEVDSGERAEETGLAIERILILIRNILHVAADPDAEKRPDNDASVHDQVLWALHQSGMLDIILYVSSADEKAYYMHILEIMCYLLREQNAKELASAALQRSENEKMRDEAELLTIRHKETHQRQQKVKAFHGTRHSRFGGTFVVKSLKSISDNELIYHKPLSNVEQIDFDGDKRRVRPPKNRAPLKSTTQERRSAFSIRLFLKEFCIEFLNGAYNTFMYVVKERLSRHQAQKHDETYYMWALRFFLEFNRNYRFDIKLVSETMSVSAFQYVQRQLETYSESIISDKKNVRPWVKRLHTTLLAYRELLFTLSAMDKSTDEAVRASSKVIKSNIFYVLEYRELVLHLMILYNEVIMGRDYLRDMIETQHIFLKLFESYCSGNVIIVEEKTRRRKQTKKSGGHSAGEESTIDVDLLWDEISSKLRLHLQGEESVREELQWKVNSKVNEVMPEGALFSTLWNLGVQKLVISGETEEAIALILEARKLHPNLIETPADVGEQMAELQKVFFSSVEPSLKPQRTTPEDEDNYHEDEEDELEETYKTQENELKFSDFSKRLAHPKVIRACALALAHFDSNTILTNHCIIKLLHRVAFDLKMPTMLFQVSLFRTFQKIYKMKSLPQYKELVKFASYIIRQFFLVAEKNHQVFMEALFWKSPRDACEIEEGYGSYREKSKASMNAWTEVQEDELRKLFIEHRENNIQTDVVDWIVDNLVDNTRTRRGVLKKLKELYLLTDYKAGGKKSSGRMPPKEWSEEEMEQLTQLYQDHKEAIDPLGIIFDRLDVRRPKKRIADKLLELGLVQDKKELRKKRVRKSRKSSGFGNEMAGNDEITDLSDISDTDDEITDFDDSLAASNSENVSQPSSRSKLSKKSSASSQSRARSKLTTQIITKILLNLPEELNPGLDWLLESLQDVAEDKENDPEDCIDSIPLVPILECSIMAMDQPQFLELLRAFGIQAPTNEQETYWRIPGNLSLSELQNYIDLLKRALAKTLIQEEVPNGDETILEKNPNQSEEIHEDVSPVASQPVEEDADVSEAPESATERTTLLQEEAPQINEKFLEKSRLHREKLKMMVQRVAQLASSNLDPIVVEQPVSEEPEEVEPEPIPEKRPGRRIRFISSSEDEEDNQEKNESIGDVIGEDESNRMSWRPTQIHDYDGVEEESTAYDAKALTEEANEPRDFFRPARIIMSDDDEGDMECTAPLRPSPENDLQVRSSEATTNITASTSGETTPEDALMKDAEVNKENVDTNVILAITAPDSSEKRSRSLSPQTDEDIAKPKPKKRRILDSDDED